MPVITNISKNESFNEFFQDFCLLFRTTPSGYFHNFSLIFQILFTYFWSIDQVLFVAFCIHQS